jgi:hypothetical protein
MTDILTNPVDICFGSMPATSATPTACFVIESNTVTTDQQIEADPTSSYLISQLLRYGVPLSAASFIARLSS